MAGGSNHNGIDCFHIFNSLPRRVLYIFNFSQTPECKARVPELKEGNIYLFRVRAVNKAGPGEPGDATEPHTAKARFCEFLILIKAVIIYIISLQ